jgi:hypothetical protein
MGSPDGLKAKSKEKQGTRSTASPNNAVRMKKKMLPEATGRRLEMLGRISWLALCWAMGWIRWTDGDGDGQNLCPNQDGGACLISCNTVGPQLCLEKTPDPEADRTTNVYGDRDLLK